MKKPLSLLIAAGGSDDRVVAAVRRALSELGVDVFSYQDMNVGEDAPLTIFRAILTSDFLVADITDQNPNVMYELGIAHAMRKPTILIVMMEAGRTIPSDLAGSSYIVYEPSDLKSLVRRLQRAASVFLPKEAMAG